MERAIFFFCVLGSFLWAETVSTFYGPIEVEEPVLLELIASPPMQRLKQIHQYGVAYYTTHQEDYNRYDHSIGVFAVLRKSGASLEEQVAGLLHDVSHTVFSHVGDWVFGKEHQDDDYQSDTFQRYLVSSGLAEILMRHGLSGSQIAPKSFSGLEQSLPNLCADRIDYNLQGAFFQGFLTREEAKELFDDFRFVEGRWVAKRVDLVEKLARYSLFMTENCWGSACNSLMSRWLADALLRALEIGWLTSEEIHCGTDEDVWSKLLVSEDVIIREKMGRVLRPDTYFRRVSMEQAELFLKFKCRGVDPWVEVGGQVVRLTSLDPEFAKALELVKRRAAVGWPVVLLQP